jgi:ribulose-5-phosphate 4-epimerase/fuculose-1-phosphate aldolase
MNEQELRDAIVEVGRRLYARGYTASNDGNISVRLDGDRLLMTPKSVCKGFMTPQMMCITDLDGRKLAGDRDPSSEMQMHLEVYRQRPDAKAVVHAHPPIATGFAVAGIPLDRAVLAEVVTTLGSVPIAEYATPSTKELPEAVRKYVKAHDGMLLANHGALTLGADLHAGYAGARRFGELPDGVRAGHRRCAARGGRLRRDESGGGNSANIPGTDRIDRGRGPGDREIFRLKAEATRIACYLHGRGFRL